MQVCYKLFFFCLGAAGLLASQRGQAQGLPLEVLVKSVAAGRVTLDSVQNLLSSDEWVLHRGPNPYWTYRTLGEAETPEDRAQAWVGLRRSNQQAYYDLVYKTRQHSNLTQLRADLRRQAKLKSELVNCVQCEGERLVGNGYTITIFKQKENYEAKHTAYPYVLVIRRTMGATISNDISPDISSQVTSDR